MSPQSIVLLVALWLLFMGWVMREILTQLRKPRSKGKLQRITARSKFNGS